MIPNLPSDNIPKFMFFAGAFVMIFSYINFKSLTNQIVEIYETQVEIQKKQVAINVVESGYLTRKADSLDVVIEQYKSGERDPLDDIREEVVLTPTEWKKAELRKTIERDSLSKDDQIEKLERKARALKPEWYLSMIAIVLGAFPTWLGFRQWVRMDKEAQGIAKLRNEILKRKFTVCQSCGTDLSFSQIKSMKIYCEHCHNGYSFTNIEITQAEMASLIRTKMESDGIAEEEIISHLSKLPSLYRWNSSFKW